MAGPVLKMGPLYIQNQNSQLSISAMLLLHVCKRCRLIDRSACGRTLTFIAGKCSAELTRYKVGKDVHVRTSYSYCTTALRFHLFQNSVVSFDPVDYKVESIQGLITLSTFRTDHPGPSLLHFNPNKPIQLNM